jgi:hypothetical protein
MPRAPTPAAARPRHVYDLAVQVLAFEKLCNAATPFNWRFTRSDLKQHLAGIRQHDPDAPHPLAA